MIAPAVVLLLVAFLVLQALVLWCDQIRRTRAEAAYWAAQQNRPDLYDWEKELGA